jgi:hypothetical protein
LEGYPKIISLISSNKPLSPSLHINKIKQKFYDDSVLILADFAILSSNDVSFLMGQASPSKIQPFDTVTEY